MSVTPPPGYGIYTRTYGPVGGPHDCVNVFGFQNTIGSTAAVAIAAQDTLMTAAGRPYVLADLAFTWEYRGSYCLVNNGGLLSSAVVPAAAAGTGAANVVGPGTSIVVSKTTALAGRQFRGRVAFPGGFLAEGDVDPAGVLNGAFVAALQAKWNNLNTAWFASPYKPVIIHGPFGTPPAPGPNPTGILSFFVTSLSGSQRRRLRG